MGTKTRAPARIAAAIGLMVAVVVLFVIVSSNQPADTGDPAARNTTEQRDETRKRPRRAVYVVKDGDTLLGIASKTGVDIGRLEDLNPEIDPQRLFAGQRIKLR